MASKTVFHSILFPVDFSGMSEATALHVRGLAEWTGATVTLLHVIPWLPVSYGMAELCPAVGDESDLRRLEEHGMLSLEIFREKYFSDIPSHREVKVGMAAETITNTAEQHGADLIMMPTRGTGPNRRFLIGSTTAKVLHDARCAVWTSPHWSSLQPFKAYQHILCTLDREDVPRGYLNHSTS